LLILRILYIFILLFLPVFLAEIEAAYLSGKTTEASGKPLPFVSIYPQNTIQGTTSNAEGFYKIELAPGEYQMVFKSIGFQLVMRKVTIGQDNIELDIQLEEEQYHFGEVVINRKNRDPAYEIIEKAQAKRAYYLNVEVEKFTCRSYVKSLGRVGKAEIKNKILGLKLFDVPNIPQNKVVYFAEAISEIKYQKPNIYKEKMLFSKVSGQAKSYSFATAFAMLSEVNFYKNYLSMGEIYERPFISPIASNAMNYYDYQLIETFNEQGYKVNKIKVIPKQLQTPVFHGYVYILEDSWRLHSLNLTVDKSTGIDYVDTLNIQQTYAPQKDSIWAIINQKFNIKLSIDLQIAKGDGSGYVVGLFSNYNITPLNKKLVAKAVEMAKEPEKFKKTEKASAKPKKEKKEKRENKHELLVIAESANKVDSATWADIRPIALTVDEVRDYKEKDSVEAIRDTKVYKDSVDHVANKMKPLDLIFGYTRRDTYHRQRFSFRPMFNSIQYNTMEGWVVNPNFSLRQRYENGKFWEIEPYLRYGFSNMHFNCKVDFEYQYNPVKMASWKVSGGKFVQDFNPTEGITPFVNSVYTLFLRQNYLKMYEKAYVKVTHGSEIVNGIYLSAGAEYAQRYVLNNTTDYSFNTNKGIHFTPNDPAAPNSPLFADNKALTIHLSARFTIGQKYLSYPGRKITLGTKYPIFSVNYRKGIPTLLNSNVNFDYLSVKAEYDLNLKKLGEANIEVQSGVFLNNTTMYFADYKHFNGNKTIFSKSDHSNSFWLLDYYTYSTNRAYFEAHWEHHLNGWLTNRVPLLRNLKWQLVNSINYLYNDVSGNYVEASIGFEHIFRFFRVDYAGGYMENKGFRQGVRIGLGF
jgi:hypothetical protein